MAIPSNPSPETGSRPKPVPTGSRSLSPWAVLAFLILWAAPWALGCVIFDVFTFGSMLKQLRAAREPAVAATVTESRVQTSDSGDGTSYTPVVHYAYFVDDRRYESARYRYGIVSVGERSARAVVAAHPVGSKVVAHYRPENPSDAVVVTGIEGVDLFVIVFLMPFNLVALLSVAAVAAGFTRPSRMRRPGGVRVRRDGYVQRVRLPGHSPAAVAGAAAVGLWIIASVVCGIASGLSPSVSTMVLTIGGLVAVTLAIYLKLAIPVWSGARDLVIDPMARTLELPLTHGRRSRETVPFAGASVEVERRSRSDGEGGTRWEYLTTVCRADPPGGGGAGAPRVAVLAKWGDAARAETFAAWLREQIAGR